MVTIAMFNNKGGVGKTTLTNNIGAYLAEKHRKRVLIVDCDPQCNTTQLLMGYDFSTELYWEGQNTLGVTTISDILQPIEDGEAEVITNIIPVKSSDNRFNVDLIPGNPKFSIIEDQLGEAWHDLTAGGIGGFRKTNWNRSLVSKLSSRYDFIFYDLGPSLGSINRSVLLGCDYFLTPMGSDIFSILGARNIAEWLQTTLNTYQRSIGISKDRHLNRLTTFGLDIIPPISKGYLGYTIQQYITKSIKGERRPTKAYEKIINSVPEIVHGSLGSYMKPGLEPRDLELGDVPHTYSLIPLAQTKSSPITKLGSADGLVGSQYKQVEEYESILERIVTNLLRNLEK